jgi:hypothetical protein
VTASTTTLLFLRKGDEEMKRVRTGGGLGPRYSVPLREEGPTQMNRQGENDNTWFEWMLKIVGFQKTAPKAIS